MRRFCALTSLRSLAGLVLLFGSLTCVPCTVFAQEGEEAKAAEAAPAEAAAAPEAAASEDESAPPSLEELAYAIDNIVLFLSAVLVIAMQAGFALVETGLNASKNAVNIMFKNTLDFCVGVLLYWVIGYGLMYPGDSWFGAGEYLGFAGVGVSETSDVAAPGKLHPQVDFLFQVAFAATAATIVSGAVAGRIKFSAYMIYSAIITGLVYPISGSWKWGQGWLHDQGFHDFAGSIVVHAVGGFAGLAGAIALGPRKGRFSPEGKPIPMPGHNIPFAAIGVFVLLIGWYGFNPGSQLAFAGKSNTDATVLIAVNTTLAAVAGGVAATLLSWVTSGKPDLTMALNGILGGLVGITANCDCVTNIESMAIGAIAGVLVLFSILALDKLRIDDPVGAFPVHGVCGLWGGLATGIFGADKVFATQLKGSLVVILWAFVTMMAVFMIMKITGTLRVHEEEEVKGLDISEHGMEAYYHA